METVDVDVAVPVNASAVVVDAVGGDWKVVETVDVDVAVPVDASAVVVDAVGGDWADVETVDVHVGFKSLWEPVCFRHCVPFFFQKSNEN